MTKAFPALCWEGLFFANTQKEPVGVGMKIATLQVIPGLRRENRRVELHFDNFPPLHAQNESSILHNERQTRS